MEGHLHIRVGFRNLIENIIYSIFIENTDSLAFLLTSQGPRQVSDHKFCQTIQTSLPYSNGTWG